MKDEEVIIPTKGWKKDTLRFQKESSERAKIRYYCSCGHSVIIPYQVDKRECDWCHKMLYKKELDEKRYFRDKMRRLLNGKEG